MLGRRAAVLGVSVVLAVLGTFSPAALPIVQAASGQPGISLDPSCVAPFTGIRSRFSRLSVTVHGHNFVPGAGVDVQYASDTPDAVSVGQETVSAYGRFDHAFQVLWPTQSVLVAILASDTGATLATAVLQVPCPQTLSVTPTCGPANDGSGTQDAYALAISGEQYSPGVTYDLSLTGPGVQQTLTSVQAASDGTLTASVSLNPLPPGTYAITAAPAVILEIFVNRTPTALFEVPCLTPPPSVTLKRDCGPAGAAPDTYSIEVTGQGFRPTGSISIVWDPYGPLTPDGTNEEWDGIETLQDGSFQMTIDPYRRASGNVQVQVTQYATGSPDVSAVAAFSVPCATATLTIDAPRCDWPQLVGDAKRTYSIGVSGSGFEPDLPIVITFDADGVARDVVTPQPEVRNADANGFLEPTTIHPAARPTGTYRISATQTDTDGTLLQDAYSQDFSVPCKPAAPVLTLRTTCGPAPPGVPYAILVDGKGFLPGPVRLIFDAGGTQEFFTATAVANGRTKLGKFSGAVMDVARRPTGTYRITGDQRDARGVVASAPQPSASDVLFTVPCVPRTIQVLPAVGQTGFVTFAQGAGFDPGTTVTLTWDRGIGANQPVQVPVQPDGSFRVGILIFANDLTGQRVLTAGLPSDPAAYPGVTADFTVLAGTGQPQGGGFDGGLRFVFRP